MYYSCPFDLRVASRYNPQVEWTLNKFILRRQDRSLLKYTNGGVCSILEKRICLLKKILGFH
jgi:hypothetical protein